MPTDPTIDLLLAVYADTLTYLREAVADIPDHRFAEQPNGLVNHPAWTLAHLAATSGSILQLLDEPTDPSLNAEFKLHGPGSTPNPSLAAYPSKADLLALLSSRHTQVAAAIPLKHATYFPRPSPDHLKSFAPTLGRILVFLLTAHETYHLGQLMQWRRAAGITTP